MQKIAIINYQETFFTQCKIIVLENEAPLLDIFEDFGRFWIRPSAAQPKNNVTQSNKALTAFVYS